MRGGGPGIPREIAQFRGVHTARIYVAIGVVTHRAYPAVVGTGGVAAGTRLHLAGGISLYAAGVVAKLLFEVIDLF